MSDLTVPPLEDRLRAASQGYPEWRVQHPVERCYCISFTRDDSVNPEREASEWLEEFKRKFPEHSHAGYEVARVQVQTQADQLMIEAADALASLQARLKAAERSKETLLDALRWMVAGSTQLGVPIHDCLPKARAAIDAATSQEGK
jgi:hypothetical protein